LDLEYFDIARLLLDHGADPNTPDNNGKTPIDIAMEEREKIEDETKRREYDEIIDEMQSRTT
jgi:ankyrin repeat protein